jgi:hypothetical protein
MGSEGHQHEAPVKMKGQRWPLVMTAVILLYMWLNSEDPYRNVRTGDACGDGVHWVVEPGKRGCIPD